MKYNNVYVDLLNLSIVAIMIPKGRTTIICLAQITYYFHFSFPQPSGSIHGRKSDVTYDVEEHRQKRRFFFLLVVLFPQSSLSYLVLFLITTRFCSKKINNISLTVCECVSLPRLVSARITCFFPTQTPTIIYIHTL